jgi:hypothetical protein
MCGGDGVGRVRGCPALLGEVGGEALVEALHGHAESLAKAPDELLRLHCLYSVVPHHRERQSHDDPLGLVLGDELCDPCEAGVAPCSLDDAEWTRDRSGRIGDP